MSNLADELKQMIIDVLALEDIGIETPTLARVTDIKYTK